MHSIRFWSAESPTVLHEKKGGTRPSENARRSTPQKKRRVLSGHESEQNWIAPDSIELVQVTYWRTHLTETNHKTRDSTDRERRVHVAGKPATVMTTKQLLANTDNMFHVFIEGAERSAKPQSVTS